MTSIDICIYAEGSLPAEEVIELADLGLHWRPDQVVLDGTVADQAALIGVLERLRRAGMRIREVSSASSGEDDRHLALIAVVGQVGDLVRAVLVDAVVTEQPTTTTAEVVLSRDDDLFDAIRRLGELSLELCAVQVVRSADPASGVGIS
ncbi:MAG: hypothetical protein ABR500_05820 [Dermatophilaceae bacterium]